MNQMKAIDCYYVRLDHLFIYFANVEKLSWARCQPGYRDSRKQATLLALKRDPVAKIAL